MGMYECTLLYVVVRSSRNTRGHFGLFFISKLLIHTKNSYAILFYDHIKKKVFVIFRYEIKSSCKKQRYIGKDDIKIFYVI